MPVRQKMKRTQGININEPHGRDLFQTPNYATDLLVPFIPKDIRDIWECAAGDRKIADRLEFFGYRVLATDIRLIDDDGNVKEGITPTNFLTHSMRTDIYRKPHAIITNPPFSLKKQFYDKCVEYKIPFALLIPTDYCGWIIEAIQMGAEKIIPTRRIDYITPSGLSGANGHSANFHSMWLTKGFGLNKTETFVELTAKMKENI